MGALSVVALSNFRRNEYEISQSKIAQTSPPPSINLVTVKLQYPLLPPTPKKLRLRPKYGKYSNLRWRGGVMFPQLKSM